MEIVEVFRGGRWTREARRCECWRQWRRAEQVATAETATDNRKAKPSITGTRSHERFFIGDESDGTNEEAEAMD
jgi:hypothetical protein